MLDSYGVVLSVLWLIALAGIFLFGRWLQRFLATTELTADIQVLILISFVGLLALGALSYLWKLGASSPPNATVKPNTPTANANPADTAKQAEIDLERFEKDTYPDLYGLRQQLLQQLQQLDNFFNAVRTVAAQKPEQRFFLQKIVDIRWERRQALRAAYAEIDLSRREFWLHYQSGQNSYVRKMFDTEAERLQKSIQDALTKSLGYSQDETNLINHYIHYLGDSLQKPQTKSIKGKVQTNLPAKIPRFVPYGGANYQAILHWLQQRQATNVIQNIESLRQEEQVIRNKIAYILQYQQLNPDLTPQVKELVINWNEALIFNQYSQYRLLHVAEALATIEVLVLEADRRDVEWLQTQLQTMAPQVVQQAEEEKMVAAYSYNPELDHKYRSNSSKTPASVIKQ